MHEYSITCSIIEIVRRLAEEKDLKKISKIDFAVNEFASIEPDSVRFYFEFLIKDDSLLKDAALNFVSAKPEVTCKSCNKVFTAESIYIKCPYCDGNNIKVERLDDIRITALHTD